MLVVAFFLVVTGIAHAFDSQRESLGKRWYTRGDAELQASHFPAAISDFRTALLYSRDNYTYQLDLAEALIGAGKRTEANAYFVNLWEREPENGVVNLELARIAAQSKKTNQALRYYHNAVYATWPANQESERRHARLELIEYLLGTHAQAQAQSELIALSANLADNPARHLQVGQLFLQADDYEHALAQFRLSLKKPEPAAWAGAGKAAYNLHRYSLARHYLEYAVSANPKDKESLAMLETAKLVLQMDPFANQIPFAERSRIVIFDIATAGSRIHSCLAPANPVQAVPANNLRPALANNSQPALAADTLQQLADTWTQMKPKITERGLRKNPELIETAMSLVFEIERQTSLTCGASAGTDQALLLIANLHEGN